jgi:hypothetical protein
LKIIKARVKFNGKVREVSCLHSDVYSISKAKGNLEISKHHVAKCLKVTMNRVIRFWIEEKIDE